jgi:hypothetical protein
MGALALTISIQFFNEERRNSTSAASLFAMFFCFSQTPSSGWAQSEDCDLLFENLRHIQSALVDDELAGSSRYGIGTETGQELMRLSASVEGLVCNFVEQAPASNQEYNLLVGFVDSGPVTDRTTTYEFRSSRYSLVLSYSNNTFQHTRPILSVVK